MVVDVVDAALDLPPWWAHLCYEYDVAEKTCHCRLWVDGLLMPCDSTTPPPPSLPLPLLLPAKKHTSRLGETCCKSVMSRLSHATTTWQSTVDTCHRLCSPRCVYSKWSLWGVCIYTPREKENGKEKKVSCRNVKCAGAELMLVNERCYNWRGSSCVLKEICVF